MPALREAGYGAGGRAHGSDDADRVDAMRGVSRFDEAMDTLGSLDETEDLNILGQENEQ